jgi:cyclohexanone monooxygenase
LVSDPATAAGLKAWYRQLCKRPCFHDEYLQAFNEPGVHLVDTDGKGVTRITERGVVVGDTEYEVDCIIYASGFEVGTAYTRRSGYDMTGRGGARLSDEWADGMKTKHGIHVHGFPNAFFVQIAQGANLVSNVPHNFTEAGATIAQIVRHTLEQGCSVVEVTQESQDAWMELLLGGPALGVIGSADCTPGYYNNEGRPDAAGRDWFVGYPGGAQAYFQYLDGWRRSGAYEGLEFR